METKNLGWVQAIIGGTTPPTNKKMIWYDDTAGRHKFYNQTLAAWTFIGSDKDLFANTIAERDALVTNNQISAGENVFVIDASADTTVTSGWAYYKYIQNTFIKIAEGEDVDSIVSLNYNGNRVITREGLPFSGQNLGGANIPEFLDRLFFPAVAPIVTISGGGIRQFGASNAVALQWSVTKKTNGISSIILDGNSITVGNNINEDSDADGSQQGATTNTTTASNTDKTFVITATDNQGKSASLSTTVQYKHKRFWFKSSENLLAKTDSEISTILNSLSGGSEFADNKDQPVRSFICTDEYVYFVHLNAFGVGAFTVNGFPSSSFINKQFQYTNSNGYQAQFLITRSQNKLNSPNAFLIDIS